MPGRLWARADPAILRRIEDGLVAAIDRAAATRAPARLSGGTGAEPGFARNRRSPDGPVDTGVPILRFDDAAGRPIAILVSYACHPVVLGSDNRRWTGDYPHFVRAELEAAYPGAVVVFATGCAGDVNTGHSAAASLSNMAQAGRTFARARAIGQGIARSASTATAEDITGDIGAAEARADLAFAQRETDTPDALAEMWSEQADRAEGGGAIHRIWADWARTIMGRNCAPAPARITALRWGGARIVALPGEIFAQTALEMRQSVQAPGPVFLLAYADDNPGYIPPRDAYAQGGYEVEEAHRFYGLAATMAPGTAERLAAAGCDAAEAARTAAHHNPTNEHATEGSTL